LGGRVIKDLTKTNSFESQPGIASEYDYSRHVIAEMKEEEDERDAIE